MLPNNFKFNGDNNAIGHRRKGSFGSKKVKLHVESPYEVITEEKVSEQSLPCLVPTANDSSTDCEAPPQSEELEDDNVAYFIKKVIGDLKISMIINSDK